MSQIWYVGKSDVRTLTQADWIAAGVGGALAAPVQAAASTATTGGTLPATTQYFYKITAINAKGETVGSNEVSITTGAGATNANTVNWATVATATGFKVYRGTAAGAESILVATVGLVVTYVDTGSSVTAGTVPTANTTGQATITWNAANSWSVSQTQFSAAALAWLALAAQTVEFTTDSADTLPVRTSYNATPAPTPSQWYRPTRKATALTTAQPTEYVLAGGTGGYTVTLAPGSNGLAYGVLNNGSGTVTVAIPTGATLAGLSSNAGATVTSGLNSTVALTAGGSVDFVTDGIDFWVTG